MNEINLDQLLKNASAKTSEAEVFYSSSRTLTAFIDANKLDVVQESSNSGYALRVIKDKKTGFASSNDFKKSAATLENAISASKYNLVNPTFSLPKNTAHAQDSFDKKIKEINAEKLSEIAKALITQFEEKKVFTPITQIKASVIDYSIKNSSGVDYRGVASFFYLEPYIISGVVGKRSEVIKPYTSRSFDENAVYAHVGEAIDLAKKTESAKPIESGEYDVILAPSEFTALLSQTVCEMSSGRTLVEGVSIYSNKENQRVMDEKISLTTGLNVEGNAFFALDQEGAHAEPIKLIERGVFKQHYFDSYYAALAGKKTTANCRRIATNYENWYSSPPTVHLNNFETPASSTSLESLISETKRGILVERTGWPLADPVSGKFSCEVRSGFLIEKGELASAVKLCIVTGGMYEILDTKLTALSRERETTLASSNELESSGTVPYALFQKITVAGK